MSAVVMLVLGSVAVLVTTAIVVVLVAMRREPRTFRWWHLGAVAVLAVCAGLWAFQSTDAYLPRALTGGVAITLAAAALAVAIWPRPLVRVLKVAAFAAPLVAGIGVVLAQALGEPGAHSSAPGRLVRIFLTVLLAIGATVGVPLFGTSWLLRTGAARESSRAHHPSTAPTLQAVAGSDHDGSTHDGSTHDGSELHPAA